PGLGAGVIVDYSGAMTRAPTPDNYVPDGTPLDVALQRTTHLGIGAHPDDLEIIAIHGILACYQASDAHFTGIVACDGSGSPRDGAYAGFDNARMAAQRRLEQRQAAELGAYNAVIQLGFPSDAVKNDPEAIESMLVSLLLQSKPEVVYMHQLVDRHATHRVLARATIKALRRLPAGERPRAVYGVEVWGSLDWLPAPWRTALPIDDPEKLQAALLRCHDSQINGGKRYDKAVIARQKANATLAESHATDSMKACALAMDLTPLMQEDGPSVDAYLRRCFSTFASTHAPHT
ncbi:MAG: PIG-L family deacetylase, partial [Halieaceae bacterium]|nr:PIG-L family deacetylase [Halieaceae bacterium]